MGKCIVAAVWVDDGKEDLGGGQDGQDGSWDGFGGAGGFSLLCWMGNILRVLFTREGQCPAAILGCAW